MMRSPSLSQSFPILRDIESTPDFTIFIINLSHAAMITLISSSPFDGARLYREIRLEVTRDPRNDYDFDWVLWLRMEDVIGDFASRPPEPFATIEQGTTLICQNHPGPVSLM
jgi:hypothetical protein